MLTMSSAPREERESQAEQEAGSQALALREQLLGRYGRDVGAGERLRAALTVPLPAADREVLRRHCAELEGSLRVVVEVLGWPDPTLPPGCL